MIDVLHCSRRSSSKWSRQFEFSGADRSAEFCNCSFVTFLEQCQAVNLQWHSAMYLPVWQAENLLHYELISDHSKKDQFESNSFLNPTILCNLLKMVNKT